MGKTRYNYDGILEHLVERVKETLGIDNVFAGTRPAAVKGTMNVFAVVELGNIYDGGDTYQMSDEVNIYLFVKDKQSGIENSRMLGEMTRRMAAALPIKDELFFLSSPMLRYSGSDRMDYHVNIIGAEMLIYK